MDTWTVLRELLERNRSIRRFDHGRKISHEDVEQLVGLTRYCASGRNLQPLRYRIVVDDAECAAVFPSLAWAGYYKDWDGPAENERPVAYLVQCLDTELTTNCLCDDGLHLETITLGAAAKDISCCIIKSFNKKKVAEALRLPSHCDPLYVVAIGYDAEKAKIVDVNSDGDIKYYRDAADTQCVPKRALEELIIKN